jgi:RNA polymerase sigma factor (sigma-70 family)
VAVPVRDVTRILQAIEEGQPRAAEQLLPLVYNELRKLAASRLAREAPGQTLDATALVHEAYVRLAGRPGGGAQEPARRGSAAASGVVFRGRAHFFAAAAEAMRRILIDRARRKRSARHGGGRKRVELEDQTLAASQPVDSLLLLDEALERLSQRDPAAGMLVKYRYYTGCSIEEAAEMAGLPRATAYRHWLFARAWLLEQVNSGSARGKNS